METILKVCGVLYLLLVGGCGFLMIAGGKAANDAIQEIEQQRIEDAKDDISLSQFNQLQNGMTYQQVVSILGRDGTVQSENTLPDGFGGQLHTVMYDWRNSDFGGMNAMFQNGGMAQKSQFNLK